MKTYTLIEKQHLGSAVQVVNVVAATLEAAKVEAVDLRVYHGTTLVIEDDNGNTLALNDCNGMWAIDETDY